MWMPAVVSAASVLKSVSCVVTRDHLDVHGFVTTEAVLLWWYVLRPECMVLSVVCVIAEACVEVCGLYCLQKPFGSL